MTDKIIKNRVRQIAELQTAFERHWKRKVWPNMKGVSKLNQAAAMIAEWNRWRKEQA